MLDGIRRHWEVLRSAWREELESSGSRRVYIDHDFLPAAIEIQERPPSPAGRMLLWLIIGFFFIALLWSLIGQVDVVAVAQGKLVPKGNVKVIQPAELGVVRVIHVQNGDRVKAGQVLVELDQTLASADRSRAEGEGIVALAGVARGEAIIRFLDGGDGAYAPPPSVPAEIARVQERLTASQIAEYKAQHAALSQELAERRADYRLVEQEVAKLRETLPLLEQQVEARRILLEKGLTSRLLFLELQERFVNHRQDLAIETERLEKVRATIQTTERKLDQVRQEFRRKTLTEYAENNEKAASLAQELIKATQRTRLQRLVAPVDGVVQELAVHTVGGVVQAGDAMLVVVPSGGPNAADLQVEALVLNKDIGFVAAGQEVEIKLEAFPFTRYGVIHGKVDSLARDAIQDKELGLVYPARVSLAKDYVVSNGDRIPLGSGMAATAEIKTGKRRLIGFIFSPIIRYKEESLRER